MGFDALFRLLSWRSGVFLALYLIFTVCFVLFFYADERFPGTPRPGRLNFFALFISAFVGSFLGGVVAGIRRCWFSWTLPNLGRRILTPLLLSAIITAFLVAWLYKRLGGSAPWLPVITFDLLWFSLGFVHGWYFWGMFGTLKSNVLQTSVFHIRPFGFMILTLSVLVFASFAINRIADFSSSQPVYCVILSMLAAWLLLRHVLGHHAAKLIALFPARDVNGFTGGLTVAAPMTLNRMSVRKSQERRPFTGIFNMIRAGEYENLGMVRGGWPVIAVGLSVVAVLCVVILAYYKGFERGSHEAGVQFVHHAIFDPASKKNMTVLVSIFPAMIVSFHSLLGTTFLKGNLLYPLTRIQIAKIAFWGSLFHNAVFCVILLLTSCLAGSLAWFFAEYESPYKLVPEIIRPLTLMFAFSPFLSWIRLRFGLSLMSFWGGVFPFTFGVGILGILWLETGTGISSIYEILGCTALILLSQCLFRYKVNRYFKTGDLV